MHAYNPQYADRIFDPRPLVATVGDEESARAAGRREAAQYAEDCPNFRAMNREMRGNRGVL